MTSEYDQAARYAAKHLDAEGFLRWLLPRAMAVRVFRRFLDTRTLTFPGEPDRTGLAASFGGLERGTFADHRRMAASGTSHDVA
jgi:hypothetical protein